MTLTCELTLPLESPFYRHPSSPAYLNDSYGRSITPIIEDGQPPLEPPTQTRITKAEREAAAELEKLEDCKGIVGPTMDRQGCILASKERRETFLSEEDFEDVVQVEQNEG